MTDLVGFDGVVDVVSGMRGFPCHLRFLRNVRLAFWQTYSNPTSSSALIYSGFSKTSTVNPSLESSEFAFNVDADSSVLHAFVSKEVLDMEYVFGAVIFCRGFHR